MSRFGCERGQSTVEFVAMLPMILLAGLVAWQLVLVGHVAWDAAGAARSGARAKAVGRDAAAGARSGVRVQPGAGAVRVEMRPPQLVPWLGSLIRVHATAAVAAPGGLPLIPGVPIP